ncbi:hypothetical protein, partial [Marinobacter salsuginis]|uniref:hypothetical protein n=1 Tax=Marinobacter salsuginis TaxID=418719 RepID=UPI00273DD8DD
FFFVATFLQEHEEDSYCVWGCNVVSVFQFSSIPFLNSNLFCFGGPPGAAAAEFSRLGRASACDTSGGVLRGLWRAVSGLNPTGDRRLFSKKVGFFLESLLTQNQN